MLDIVPTTELLAGDTVTLALGQERTVARVVPYGADARMFDIYWAGHPNPTTTHATKMWQRI